jgi:hypothetical protein
MKSAFLLSVFSSRERLIVKTPPATLMSMFFGSMLPLQIALVPKQSLIAAFARRISTRAYR